jgi:hypothetical protein
MGKSFRLSPSCIRVEEIAPAVGQLIITAYFSKIPTEEAPSTTDEPT